MGDRQDNQAFYDAVCAAFAKKWRRGAASCSADAIDSPRQIAESDKLLGIGIAMFGSGQQIAVGRPGVDTGEHGLGALINFVVQADSNWREVDAAVDYAGLPRRRLMNVVDGALADAHAQQVKSRINSTTPR